MNLYNILIKGVNINLDNIAIVCDEETYTYAQLNKEVLRLAESYKKAGVTKGCKVLVALEDPIKYIITLFAVSYLNAIFMPVYSRTGIEKILNIIDKFKVNYFINDVHDDELPYFISTQEYNEISIYQCSEEIDVDINNTALILFTSGTTSIPKAIMLSYNNIISNVDSISLYLKIRNNDKLLLVKSLVHSSSIIGELFVGISNGCTIVLTRKLPLAFNILKNIQEKKISIFFAIPTLLNSIIQYKNIKKYKLDSLRVINFYGAPMHTRKIEKLINIFTDCNVIYSYGLTEASPRVTYIEKEDLLNHPGSSGKPIQNVVIKIVDGNMEEVAPYTKGEIVVMGPNVMQGYYMDEDKTQKTIMGEWLRTGDVGHIDDEGFLYVSGRLDNMIISSGRNIYLEEIEGVLNNYDDIFEAVVAGKKDDYENYELIGYVVLKDKRVLDYNKLYDFLNRQLEKYKVPKRIEVVDHIEKTQNGKIRRSHDNY